MVSVSGEKDPRAVALQDTKSAISMGRKQLNIFLANELDYRARLERFNENKYSETREKTEKANTCQSLTH